MVRISYFKSEKYWTDFVVQLLLKSILYCIIYIIKINGIICPFVGRCLRRLDYVFCKRSFRLNCPVSKGPFTAVSLISYL